MSRRSCVIIISSIDAAGARWNGQPEARQEWPCHQVAAFSLWANGDRSVHRLEIDGQSAQRHHDGSRTADLDNAIDTAAIGQLTGLHVPVRLSV